MVDLEEGQRAKEKYAFGARVCNTFVLLFNIRVQQEQFNFLFNKWTEDALSTALHSVLSYLDNKNTYIRMLFVDVSLAFNTI